MLSVLMQLSDFTKQAHLIFVPTIESKHQQTYRAGRADNFLTLRPAATRQ